MSALVSLLSKKPRSSAIQAQRKPAQVQPRPILKKPIVPVEPKESVKEAVVKKVVKAARDVVEELADDSSTESYYDDDKNVDKLEYSSEDEDGDSKKDGQPTKRRMAGAVIKVGRMYEETKKENAELKKVVHDLSAQIERLQKTIDDKRASKAEKAKAEAVKAKVEAKVEEVKAKIEDEKKEE